MLARGLVGVDRIPWFVASIALEFELPLRSEETVEDRKKMDGWLVNVK